MGMLLIVLIVVVAVVLLWRRRPAPPAAMPPASPYARDDAFGRPDAYAPHVPPAEGMGPSLARGLGTGLAIGAGAVLAQEVGRRMFEHGQDPAAAASGHDASLPHQGSAADSQLARDAGIGAFDGRGPAPEPQVHGLLDDAPGGWDDAPDLDAGGGDDWS